MPVVQENVDDLMLVRAWDKGKFVRVNDSFNAKVGFDAAELAEKPFHDWIDPCDHRIVQAALENHEKSFFARHITRDGNTLQLQIQLAEHEDGPFVLGRCAKAPTQLDSDGARSADATVSGTLDAIAQIIEEQNPGYKCSILLVANGCFVFGAGPSLPAEYNSAVNGYAIGPTVGSCGTAIFWNTPVIVEDIQADPLWSPLAELAKKAGVAACWSHPFVSSNGKVLGALALYSPEPRTPTPEQLGLLRASARITGLAVERGRAEEELKRAEETIKKVSNQLQATLNALPDLLFEVDSEGRFIRYHTHRTDLLATMTGEFVGKRFADVLPPSAANSCQRAIDKAAQKGFSYGETYQIALPQGECWFELSVASLHADDNSNQHFVIICRDITDRKNAEKQTEQLAYFDTLTGLPNRRMLTDRLLLALEQAKRFDRALAVMFLDLDEFKAVNDTYGHYAGDKFLKEMAARLRNCIRSGDTVARHGGDEFIIVLSEINGPDDAAVVAEKIVAALREPVPLEGHGVQVSVSVGIAVRSINGTEDAQALMKAADGAMYAAKAAGRNGYRFSKNNSGKPGKKHSMCIA